LRCRDDRRFDPRLALKSRGTVGHLLATVVYVMVNQCMLPFRRRCAAAAAAASPAATRHGAQLATRHPPKCSKGVIRDGGHACLAASP
jgi:hypothetical protein